MTRYGRRKFIYYFAVKKLSSLTVTCNESFLTSLINLDLSFLSNGLLARMIASSIVAEHQPAQQTQLAQLFVAFIFI